MPTEKEYILGTHDAELERLGLQHRVWRPHALAAWQRAGFTLGQTILDVGCGPGYAALDLAELVGPTGRVIGIDRSRRFLDALDAAARSRGLTWLQTVELDLDSDELPPQQADGAWSRWVYAFVREPRRLLERMKAVLRPGGVIALHEYADYRTWRLSPRRERFEAFVREVMASWRETGGEPDVGHDLPRWLEELGFEIRSIAPRVEIARPGDPWWPWPRAFVDVGLQRLVALGRVSEADARAVAEDFLGVEATPGAFQVTPMVVEVIAVLR